MVESDDSAIKPSMLELSDLACTSWSDLDVADRDSLLVFRMLTALDDDSMVELLVASIFELLLASIVELLCCMLELPWCTTVELLCCMLERPDWTVTFSP